MKKRIALSATLPTWYDQSTRGYVDVEITAWQDGKNVKGVASLARDLVTLGEETFRRHVLLDDLLSQLCQFVTDEAGLSEVSVQVDGSISVLGENEARNEGYVDFTVSMAETEDEVIVD